MRVFVAINPSSEERARLAEASRALRDADYPIRWVAPENVHLTLKFLGEVAEAQLPGVCAAVDESAKGLGALEMAVRDFGAFPNLRRPQVVWAGLEASTALEALQSRVEGALADLGFPRERRAFRPHLTLGRAQKRTRVSDFDGLEELVKGLSYDDVYRVGGVDVMRSRLMPRGAIYDVVHTAELGS